MASTDTLSANGAASQWIGNPNGIADAVFQLTGTWTATITFECCTEGNEASPTPIAVSAVATPGTLVTTAAANGIFKTNNGFAGGLKVRARVTAFTSGSAVVTAASADGR